ncbi:MAG: DUF2480 family protein [Saprospiraceae bacterium]|nr:DUF2480 family protein [Saprospiraceae bacterium]
MIDINLDSESLDQPLVNRVANSGLITIDLETYYPSEEILEVDLKDFLFQGVLLKEKEFREKVKTHHWEQYAGHPVALVYGDDMLVQQWAFMLLAAALKPYAQSVHLGNKQSALVDIYQGIIRNLDVASYKDKRVIIKGCSSKAVPNEAYMAITQKLQPVVSGLMFGEACSTVPVYKKPKS